MSAITTYAPVVLELAAQELVLATAHQSVEDLTPEAAREGLDRLQGEPVTKLPVDDTWVTVPAEVGGVGVRIVRPPGAAGPLPAILYLHGGGWVLGNSATHDRLVRELAVGSDAALLFVD